MKTKIEKSIYSDSFRHSTHILFYAAVQHVENWNISEEKYQKITKMESGVRSKTNKKYIYASIYVIYPLGQPNLSNLLGKFAYRSNKGIISIQINRIGGVPQQLNHLNIQDIHKCMYA